jgi:hypothetical protein
MCRFVAHARQLVARRSQQRGSTRTVTPSQQPPANARGSTHKGFIMVKTLYARVMSFSLSAVVTVAMLVSVNVLAQPDAPAQQWAQKTSPRA